VSEFALAGIAELAEDEAVFAGGGLFEPLGYGTEELVQLLPEIMAKSRLMVGCAANPRFAERVLPLAPDEPSGSLLAWPEKDGGVMLLVIHRDKRNLLGAIWPFVEDRRIHDISVEKVRISANRLQALIEAEIDGIPVAFIDTKFALDRVFYRIGSRHRYAISGFLHDWETVDSPPITLRQSEVPYDLRKVFGQETLGPDGNVTVHTKGMASLIPATEQPSNWYVVQGPVQSVVSTLLMNARAWKIEITAARHFEEDDVELRVPLYVMESRLHGRTLPAPGDDIRATIWLQGHIVEPNIDG
jgi:hypothetical protein